MPAGVFFFVIVVSTDSTDYVLTTIEGTDMPRFALFCHFAVKCVNDSCICVVRKKLQNTAKRGILGRRNR